MMELVENSPNVYFMIINFLSPSEVDAHSPRPLFNYSENFNLVR